MAETVGFEPTRPLRVNGLANRPSTIVARLLQVGLYQGKVEKMAEGKGFEPLVSFPTEV